MRTLIYRKTWITWGWVFIFLFTLGGASHAQEAALTDIIVNNTRDHLLLYLQVTGAFTEEMKEGVLSGVPTTFSFFIDLYAVRDFWFNKKITDLTVTHTIKYNNLKKEFIVQRSWEENQPLATTSLEEAQALMTEIDSLKIVELNRLEKGRQYRIKAKAELSELTLPFYLHYVLFFVSLWDFETDWYTIDFIY
ncbi:MAG: DUF4390 domain-containing protein [Desulfobacterales bacterium]|nr:DUF4390 domain-containing protein [Desulfobacterales bacterium]